MLDNIQQYLNEGILSEAGMDFVIKCSTPRLMESKYFSVLSAKKFKVQMTDDSNATIRITNVSDLVNLMKAVERNLMFDKSGDFFVIMDRGS